MGRAGGTGTLLTCALLIPAAPSRAQVARGPVSLNGPGLPGAPALPQAFPEFRERFFDTMVSFHPELAVGLGLPDPGGLSDLSEAALRAQAAFLEEAGRRLDAPELSRDLDPQDRIDLDLMRSIARSQVREATELKSHLEDVFSADGPYETVQLQITRLPYSSRPAADWERIAARTEAIPAYLEQSRRHLRRGLSEGWRPWRSHVEKDGVEAAEEMARFFGVELLEKARETLPEDEFEAIASRLAQAGLAARRAYEEHARFMREEVLPASTERFVPDTQDYAWRLKNQLGLSETPQELHEKGLAMARELRARMEELGRRIDPTKSLPELMAEIRADHPADDRELFALYTLVSERARDFVIAKGLFHIPPGYRLNIIPTPKAMRSHMATAAYFEAPALSQGILGTFLLSPSDGDKKRLGMHSRHRIPSTVVHEAFPGHDLQFNVFQNSPGISRVRHLAGLAGHGQTLNVEGYAHYAEELMRLHGFYTPKEELGQLWSQLWRVWRVILDTGLHMGTMTVEEVARALVEEAFMPEPTAKTEAYRYTRSPLQALTYRLGRLQIEGMKEEYRAVMGERYSEAEFHRLFLSFGPVPPALLRPVLLDIARRQAPAA